MVYWFGNYPWIVSTDMMAKETAYAILEVCDDRVALL